MFARLSKLPWPEIAILAVAVFLRVWLIEIKPPHFDEGVNGWFADQMTANGYYHYDPTNYHGPLHFYAVFLSQTLFGRHLWALRLPAILASVLCVWALLRFRVYFGSPAARLAGLAMAVSPAFTFYGRYSIHESWQVLFSILFLWGILGLWKSGDRRSFFTAVFSAVGLVLTKETYLLHLGCFALAGGVLWAWQRVLPSVPWRDGLRAVPCFESEKSVLTEQRPPDFAGGPCAPTGVPPVLPERSFPPVVPWTKDDAIIAGGIAFVLIVFFYSGNFLDFPSLRGLYQTFGAWFKTGVDAGGHEKTSDAIGPLNYYWVALMARYEWPALAGLAACVRYVWPSDARLRYIAIMAGGVLLAYAIIPYKTPWCIISILWPFYLILGGLLTECAERWKSRLFLWAPAAPLLAASLVSAWGLNFINFTDDREPYVYVQTYSGIFTLTDPLLAAAESDPRQYHMSGLVLLDSYYPLPWVLGDFTRVGYYKKDQPPTAWDAGFIAVESAREGEVEPHLKQPYYKRRFHLRSAQDECTAYFAAPLFQDRFRSAPEFQPSTP
ncbi:MAG: glycosyltransferase family 39 protein [Verrucomicrobiae bacterium]